VGLFLAEERYAGADTNIRRALAQARHSSPAVLKVKEAVKLTKLKADFPVWKESAWAHIGLAQKKVAIVIVPSNRPSECQRLRDSWAQYGWRCFTISKSDVNRSTTEELARHLLDAIGGGK
jgi:hypothetical protein